MSAEVAKPVSSFFVKESERKDVPITEEHSVDTNTANTERNVSFVANSINKDQIAENSKKATIEALKNLNQDIKDSITSNNNNNNSKSASDYISDKDEIISSSDSSDDDIDDKNIKMGNMGGSKNSIKISIPSVVEKGKKRSREPEEDSLTGRFYNDNKNYQNIISDLKTKIAEQDGIIKNLKMKSQHKDSLKRFDDLNSCNIEVENKELKAQNEKLQAEIKLRNKKDKNYNDLNVIFFDLKKFCDDIKYFNTRKLGFALFVEHKDVWKRIVNLENLKSDISKWVLHRNINDIFNTNQNINSIGDFIKATINNNNISIDNEIRNHKEILNKKEKYQIPIGLFTIAFFVLLSLYIIKYFNIMIFN